MQCQMTVVDRLEEFAEPDDLVRDGAVFAVEVYQYTTPVTISSIFVKSETNLRRYAL